MSELGFVFSLFLTCQPKSKLKSSAFAAQQPSQTYSLFPLNKATDKHENEGKGVANTTTIYYCHCCRKNIGK